LSNDEKVKLTDSLLTKLRGAYLGWKQGEALERDTKPVSREESVGLGYFEVEANIALGAIMALETVINDLSGIKKEEPVGNVMYQFAIDIAVASGSRKATRLEKSLETIGSIGQVIEMPQKMRQAPIAVDFND